MMPIKLQEEPENFNTLVRIPGQEFLAKQPNPTSKQFSKPHNYWTRILDDLHISYGGICAYCCHKIHAITGNATVDHYKSKVKFPDKAYEWSNYRLACLTMNRNKGEWEDVLDPFELAEGWFVLEFPSLLIKPSDELTEEQKLKVEQTCTRLKLNEYQNRRSRMNAVLAYCSKPQRWVDLYDEAPFIAEQMRTQEISDKVKLRGIMSIASSPETALS